MEHHPLTGKERLVSSNGIFLTLKNYKEPLRDVEGGYGYYGALLNTPEGDKVQCHICGDLLAGLNMHILRKHGLKANEYRDKFKLSRSTALVSETLREYHKNQMIAIREKTTVFDRARWHKKGIRALKRTKKYSGISLETKNIRGTCPDQLLAKITEVAEKLGHTPSLRDFIDETGGQRYSQLIYHTFQSWSNALKMLKMQPKEMKRSNPRTWRYTDEELLEYLRIFHQDMRKIPTETDFRRGILPDSSCYRKRFGTIPRARELAGIYGTPTRWGDNHVPKT